MQCKCGGITANHEIIKHKIIVGYYKRCVECGRIHWVKKPDDMVLNKRINEANKMKSTSLRKKVSDAISGQIAISKADEHAINSGRPYSWYQAEQVMNVIADWVEDEIPWFPHKQALITSLRDD